MRVTHSWTDKTATIRLEGLAKPIRMVHITDTHVALIDNRDAEYKEASQSSCETFRTKRRADNGRIIPSEMTFIEVIAEVQSLNPDLLALTGDIIHFPSQANLDHVTEALIGLNTPILYTAGNHDWHFPGVEGRAALREASWPLLLPLHHGEPAFSCYTDGGIQWLTIDNSTYQVTEGQLRAVEDSLKNSIPTVLLMHIPLSLPTLRNDTHACFRAPILMGDPDWDIESREKWGTGDDLESTLEFVNVVTSARNLIAVFCGHIHFPHTDAIGPTAVQYVGAPGFEKAIRVVDFLPM